jgi:hypothetical protein
VNQSVISGALEPILQSIEFTKIAVTAFTRSAIAVDMSMITEKVLLAQDVALL